ncbi:hypothetical protein [Corynebacterium uterequi]|uniref:Uncharacterized protein n=1 Tax=Corynebacterium uterequi TaxID=1072256 RepID=A0A0G3HA51_9CORY|nr:hypothetical protein [Corynebacterium uterequi]AKK10189.1 hypothetical protein CUTER_00840 [Corynebacterium uterequi]
MTTLSVIFVPLYLGLFAIGMAYLEDKALSAPLPVTPSPNPDQAPGADGTPGAPNAAA